MRKSRGLVTGARAVALAVAVGVAASTGMAGTASTAWASVREGERSSGYSAEEIILGLMGEGVVAKEQPEVAVVPKGQAVGANESAVAAFVKLASLKEPAFAEEFRAEVTSGDPYRVRKGLERLDTMSRTIAQEVAEGQGDLGSGSGSFIVNHSVLIKNSTLVNDRDLAKVQVVDVVAAAADVAVVVEVIAAAVVAADFEAGSSGLTTEQAVAMVTKALAGK
ncbi:hypothetical protein F9278_16400 [Streptomyces phaeolivaceus]|uniref:Sporulation delaying protein family toxin n=1 Tax=Streptomyces phaeolivaceus TaxID=2653200 RepID=A0A5P8K2N2_9ACTN|nr:hypothetical protein [Streptomyces phaeolivaceus]QFQ97533.1 hypothetical protein F9278_16400 [Streptomyces phaeolivaceus]